MGLPHRLTRSQLRRARHHAGSPHLVDDSYTESQRIGLGHRVGGSVRSALHRPGWRRRLDHERSLPGLTFCEFEQLSPADLPTVASFAVSFRFWTVVPAFWLPLTLGLLLFPNGHPPHSTVEVGGRVEHPRDRSRHTATAVAQNPWSTLPVSSAETTVPGILGSLNDAGFALASMAAVASVASLVVRYRRSLGVETQPDSLDRVRWRRLCLLARGRWQLPGVPIVDAAGGLVAQSALVASYGIAITKYRLYDIDVVISKTVTYGVLAAFITGVYALIVVGIGSLVGSSDEPNLALSIAAVAIVAVAFEPLRRRVQHWANVLVYGRRATPYEVLSNATARLAGRATPTMRSLSSPPSIGEGTGASEVVLWLVVGDAVLPRSAAPFEALEDLRPVACHRCGASGCTPGRSRGPRSIPGRGTRSTEHHQSQGGPSYRRRRQVAQRRGGGGRRALAQHQPQCGARRTCRATPRCRVDAWSPPTMPSATGWSATSMTVRSNRLLPSRSNSESLERLPNVRARSTSPPSLRSLADTTQQAVDGMRAVAHGIYPPLLEAEGLAAALNAARRTISMPVDIAVTRLDRYERSVEESVYFAVLGTVTDAVDAGATLAGISLDGSDDRVRFVVDVDVAPGDLVSITDRIDALGGVLTPSRVRPPGNV